jgi:hypothetical protein
MNSINPGLAGLLVNEHLAELRRSAARGTAARAARTRCARRGSLRHKAGWALVSLGLRLVLQRSSLQALRAAR